MFEPTPYDEPPAELEEPPAPDGPKLWRCSACGDASETKQDLCWPVPA